MSTPTSPGGRPVRYGAPPPAEATTTTPEPEQTPAPTQEQDPAETTASSTTNSGTDETANTDKGPTKKEDAAPQPSQPTAEQVREQLLQEQRNLAIDPNSQKKADKKHPPQGAVIPWFWTTAGLKYHIVNRASRRLDQVPEVSGRQRPHAHYDATVAEINFYAANMRIAIVVVNPVGGSGKSFTSSLLGQYYAWITPMFPLLMPATKSTDSAATGDYTGINPSEALHISRFYALAERLSDERLKALIPRTSLGLGVITHDPEGSVGDAGSTISAEAFRRHAQTATRLADLCIMDQGNDTVDSDSLAAVSARQSDVMVFVATPGKELSLLKLYANIGRYMTDPTNLSLTTQRDSTRLRSGEQIPTAEKAQNSIALITGVNPGEGPKDYVNYTKRPSEDGRFHTDIGFTGVVLTIPKLRSLRRKRSQLNVDPRTLTLAERQALADVLVNAYRLAAQMQGFPHVYDPTRSNPTARILTKDDDALVAYFGEGNPAPHRPDNVSDMSTHHRASHG